MTASVVDLEFGHVELADETHEQPRFVFLWAGIGVACVAMFIYVMGRWALFSAANVPAGPTPVPMFMKIAVRAMEVGGGLGLIALGYWFVVRPWRRDGRISWDGTALIAYLLLYWQDQLGNYFGVFYTYNSYAINNGSWGNWIPGFAAPNAGRVAEVPLMFGTWYSYGLLLVAIFVCFLMRKAKAMWPRLGPVALFGVALAFTIPMDFIVESLYLRFGIYTYPNAPASLSLWPDHYYKLPLYEMPMWGLIWALLSVIRYYKNDKGESWAERGLSRVKAGQKQKAWLRLFAIVGLMNICYFGFNIPIAFITNAHQTEWPKDILKRSYFTNMWCGAETTRACSSTSLPLSRRGAVYWNDKGEVYFPPGVKLPEPVPLDRKY